MNGSENMAFSEIEHKRHDILMKQYIEKHRPPPHICSKLDLAYRIYGQSVEIFEVRSRIMDSDTVIDEPVAKTTFIKKTGEWHVYWMRADLKWHRYEPCPSVNTVEEFLSLIEEDEYCCFWG